MRIATNHALALLRKRAVRKTVPLGEDRGPTTATPTCRTRSSWPSGGRRPKRSPRAARPASCWTRPWKTSTRSTGWCFVLRDVEGLSTGRDGGSPGHQRQQRQGSSAPCPADAPRASHPGLRRRADPRQAGSRPRVTERPGPCGGAARAACRSRAASGKGGTMSRSRRASRRRYGRRVRSGPGHRHDAVDLRPGKPRDSISNAEAHLLVPGGRRQKQGHGGADRTRAE